MNGIFVQLIIHEILLEEPELQLLRITDPIPTGILPVHVSELKVSIQPTETRVITRIAQLV